MYARSKHYSLVGNDIGQILHQRMAHYLSCARQRVKPDTGVVIVKVPV